MATVTPEPHTTPAVIGCCYYCTEPLYADQPTSQLDEPLSHVGCAVHARRSGRRQ